MYVLRMSGGGRGGVGQRARGQRGVARARRGGAFAGRRRARRPARRQPAIAAAGHHTWYPSDHDEDRL